MKGGIYHGNSQSAGAIFVAVRQSVQRIWPNAPSAVMVFQDGHAYLSEQDWFHVPVVFDNLIHAENTPVSTVA